MLSLTRGCLLPARPSRYSLFSQFLLFLPPSLSYKYTELQLQARRSTRHSFGWALCRAEAQLWPKDATELTRRPLRAIFRKAHLIDRIGGSRFCARLLSEQRQGPGFARNYLAAAADRVQVVRETAWLPPRPLPGEARRSPSSRFHAKPPV